MSQRNAYLISKDESGNYDTAIMVSNREAEITVKVAAKMGVELIRTDANEYHKAKKYLRKKGA